MSSLLTLQNAGLYRDGKWLVRGVDLSIRKGEIITLIGPNGSGKSTTAKLALGIRRPSEGTAQRQENLRVGYVPQKLSIDWTLPLSVERLMRLTGSLSAASMDAALDRTGVLHLKKAQVQNLSGGEFQRVLMARAIARQPDLLVLDEPVQGVDYSGEIALYELIADIRKELDCGVLLISHDLHIVMAATDSVVCLNGHVCCQGSPSAVAQSSAYQQLFGPRTQSALAVYEHNHDHTHLPDGRVMHADGSITEHCHKHDGHHHAEEARNA
ncbi:metal ABC transporter ATP-binding protein [Pseudovibrio exalbescens]|uniref:ATP-binding cassette domain-containing protein n=1 Tax=Pseudovibrio exalbescens TaxID=197461 RepID=UPI002365ED0C|nr:metal ABC transporter ATP-binding protein [Pseudovibrio exalbescens]MDD7909617.1 metal ABC transporter ATP-binding protein [Pseudovibrio exalbescens]